MVGYTEVLQTMAAMIIFSMILLNANRMILRNTVMQVEGELEQEVVALAQDIIEEGRTKEFDEVNVGMHLPPAAIPNDFTDPSALGPESGETKRFEFDDFDDYNGWIDTLTTEHGQFFIETKVFYVDGTNYEEMSDENTFKKMQVFIKSKFLLNNQGEKTEYRLEFIRNFYAD
ncbi:MAG TPA: hypothetical protein VF181_12820 [Balneolaceae bacterium]